MLDAQRTESIAAAQADVWRLIADVERYAAWHPFFSAIDPLEHDACGRVVRASCRHDTSVTVLRTELRFTYDDGAGVRAERVSGDLKAMAGSFALAPGGDEIALTHALSVDPGMKLGLLLRGPVEDRVRRSVMDGAFRGVREQLGLTG